MAHPWGEHQWLDEFMESEAFEAQVDFGVGFQRSSSKLMIPEHLNKTWVFIQCYIVAH